MSESLHILQSALGLSSRRPDITFHRDGRIDITSRISAMLELHPGDIIDLCNDGNEWYLYVRYKVGTYAGKHEAQVYPTNKGKHSCHNFRAYSKRITDTVLDISGGDKAQICAGTLCSFSNIGKAVILIPKLNLSRSHE